MFRKKKKETDLNIQSHEVTSSSSLKFSLSKKRILVVVLILLFLAGISFLIFNKKDSFFVAKNCSDDQIILDKYNNAMAKISTQDEYREILTLVKEKANYNDDITCQYIAFQSFLISGDEAEAAEAYNNIKKLFGDGEVIPSGAIDDSYDLDKLLEEYIYYDKDLPPTNGGLG
jgi:hypothetical protein